MGLKFIWSNDMMWTTKDEASAINQNKIDLIIFTSEFHKFVLSQKDKSFDKINNFIIPNYFHLSKYKDFTKKPNQENKFVIGKG